MPSITEILQNNLDMAQFKAASDSAAEVLTLACAGSGKSRTLAFRIARLVAEGATPDSIVAFTFTEKAAESIKLRVAQALIAADLSPTVLGAMYIGTIHSYCQNVLGEMDATYRQFDVLDDNRLKLYLLSRFSALNLRDLQERQFPRKKPNERQKGYFKTIEKVYDAWSVVNDEMIDMQTVTASDALLGVILERLQQQLNQDQFIDFSLMIRLVAEALKTQRPAAQRAVSKLRHLMVDEYQDVNPAQETLIKELHALSETLFVVGDDDQSIYGWRGADVNNILTFDQRYPNCSVHTLSTNYRSTQAIVQVSDAFVVAELGPRRIAKNPVAHSSPSPKDFRNLWFDVRDDEADWVISRVKKLLGAEYREKDGIVRGLTPGDFAILMRSTRSSEGGGLPRHAAFTQRLEDASIAYSLEAGGSVFDRPQVNALRESFELLRNGSPTREQARQLFDNVVLPCYSSANFNRFSIILSEWGRLIHAPISGARRKVYPQQLVHDMLNAFDIENAGFDSGVMQDIGLFSRMMQDVETVYLSIDTATRFQQILNFLQNIAESGYNTSTDDVLRRPDAVTVSTVHKMKGLEFPVVFVVDVERGRFPSSNRKYQGWLPTAVIQQALNRLAYRSNPEEEIRLFYTAMTRAERYLYITGSESLPNGKKKWKSSQFTLHFSHPEISDDPTGLPQGLIPCSPAPRADETIVPTSYSDIRYYLRCPRDYQYRKSFGFSPPVPELFGFGKTVHTSIEKLHELYDNRSPTQDEVSTVVNDTFHLKHVFPSQDPENRPGPYEGARDAASSIAQTYVESYSDDFIRQKQIEVRFEIPVEQAVITGAIDLMLKQDEQGNILYASVVDFKSMEGGDIEENERLHWTELALQVQLYAKAARDVLGENAETGVVHLLKDNQRIDVPVTIDALNAAVANVEWSVERIIDGDFPMRPSVSKCENCDFKALCPKIPQNFNSNTEPPAIHIPLRDQQQMARAFSEFDDPQQS
ncbi:ATP-dependent DNA helicase [Anaerolineales bacterium HSG6]|nr:ATP-dependent DNA helicase [Anaerolineales bacterium HSG6]